jgi:hypothetical protein
MRVSMRSAYESVQTEADIPDISILVRIGHFYFDLTIAQIGLTNKCLSITLGIVSTM